MLFDDGYVLSESYYPYSISHSFQENVLNTYFASQNTNIPNPDKMKLKRDLLKESGGFAIEAYPRGSGFGSDGCETKSSEQLKPLIAYCEGEVILRMLTDEERRQIQTYKEEQKGEFT